MNDNDKNKDKDSFKEAMAAMGVKPANKDQQQKSLLTNKRPTPKPTLKSQTPANETGIRVEYKDLEPESFSETETHGLSASLTAQTVQFHQGGFNLKNLRRLQRGQYAIGERLDLHGYTIDQAIEALNNVVNPLHLESNTCLLIIHGKGYHSHGNAPKLKSLTERWLKAHPRTIAFCSAQAKDGGTGAVYVMLKK